MKCDTSHFVSFRSFKGVVGKYSSPVRISQTETGVCVDGKGLGDERWVRVVHSEFFGEGEKRDLPDG